MTGLEKIRKAIEDDANSAAAGIIAQAEKEAAEIMEASKKEAEKKCSEIALKAENDVKAEYSRAESGASLLERKILLDAKQQLINDVIMKARSYLSNLSDEEYLDVLLRLIKKNAHNKQGTIRLSKEDRNRLPKNLDILIKNALSDKEGAALMISDEGANINGGFILIYGDIEENCTFDALFNAARDELQDKVYQLLF